MKCIKCNKEISDDNAKFCPECGAELKEKEVITGGTEIPYEIVKQKSESDLENRLFKGTFYFVGAGIIYAIVGLVLNGETNFRIEGLFIGIGIVLFIISRFLHKQSPITNHYKFKCPVCHEENIVDSTIDSGFNCSKCEQKMVIVDNEIKVIK